MQPGLILSLMARRLWNTRGLASAWLAAAILAIALVVNVPLFSEAASLRVMREELRAQAGLRPLFALHLYRTWDPTDAETPQDYGQYRAVADYLAGAGRQAVPLPLVELTGRGETPPFRVARWEKQQEIFEDVPGARYRLGFADGFRDHVALADGRWPQAADAAGPVIEVLASVAETGENSPVVGDRFRLAEEVSSSGRRDPTAQPATTIVEVVGLWQAINPHEPYWFSDPTQWTGLLMLDEAEYAHSIAPTLARTLGFCSFYLIFDDQRIKAYQIDELLTGTQHLIVRAGQEMSDLRADLYNPLDELESFQRRYRSLLFTLLLFNVPIVAAMVYALLTISTLIVSAHQDETAVLRSRGASRGQILILLFAEGAIVALLAVGPALLLASGITRLMGQVVSFLAFDAGRSLLEVTLSPFHLLLACSGALLVATASIFPAWRPAAQTIVSYRLERAREGERPFWERAYLDVLLLAPALYGYWQLRMTGKISFLQREFGSGSSVYQDPLMYVVPVFFILAGTMLVVRLVPYLLAAVFRLTRGSSGLMFYLALCQLSRHPRYYSGPLLLIVLLISLGVYTAALARTLDANLRDRTYYAVGADLVLAERPLTASAATELAPEEPPDPESGGRTVQGNMWDLPFELHRSFAGVLAATRVGRYETDQYPYKNRSPAGLLGIEPEDFAQVAFLRPDYAREPIRELLSALQQKPAGLLVPRAYLALTGFRINDSVRMAIDVTGKGERVPLDFVIVGVYDYFPTIYPAEKMFFIGNLPYLASQIGGVSHYNVWLRTAPSAGQADIIAQVEEALPVEVRNTESASQLVQAAESLPERMGFFGTLSAGFLGIGALSVAAYALFAFLSLKRRRVELGILHALGVEQAALMRYLFLEQFMMLATGLGSAIGLGLLSAHVFIPLIEVGQSLRAQIPPYVIHVPWSDLALLMGMVLLALGVTLGVVAGTFRHLRLAELIKLSELQ